MDKDLLDYFIEGTKSRFEKIDDRFDKIDSKLETLVGFRWMLIGASLAVSSIVSLVIALLFR